MSLNSVTSQISVTSLDDFDEITAINRGRNYQSHKDYQKKSNLLNGPDLEVQIVEDCTKDLANGKIDNKERAKQMYQFLLRALWTPRLYNASVKNTAFVEQMFVFCDNYGEDEKERNSLLQKPIHNKSMQKMVVDHCKATFCLPNSIASLVCEYAATSTLVEEISKIGRDHLMILIKGESEDKTADETQKRTTSLNNILECFHYVFTNQESCLAKISLADYIWDPLLDFTKEELKMVLATVRRLSESKAFNLSDHNFVKALTSQHRSELDEEGLIVWIRACPVD